MSLKTLILAALVVITTAAVTVTIAQQSTPSQQEQIPVPKGFEQFFEEVSAVLKKHPEAAERFTIRDSKPAYSTPTTQARCCASWGCSSACEAHRCPCCAITEECKR